MVFQRHTSGLKRIKECAPKYRVILPLPEIVFIIKYGKWNTNSKYTTWKICFCNKILTVSYNFTSILNQNFEKKIFFEGRYTVTNIFCSKGTKESLHPLTGISTGTDESTPEELGSSTTGKKLHSYKWCTLFSPCLCCLILPLPSFSTPV